MPKFYDDLLTMKPKNGLLIVSIDLVMHTEALEYLVETRTMGSSVIYYGALLSIIYGPQPLLCSQLRRLGVSFKVNCGLGSYPINVHNIYDRCCALTFKLKNPVPFQGFKVQTFKSYNFTTELASTNF